MSVYHWISNTASRIRNDGTAGLLDSFYKIYMGAWRVSGSRLPLGTNVFEREWDMLVILDGCRTDLMRSVGTEYDSFSTVDQFQSVGSSSREWLAKTFTQDYREEIERTAYVSANPYTEEILFGDSGETRSPFNPANWPTVDPEAFVTIEDVSMQWDDKLGTVPPQSVTDAAIEVGREYSPDRLIVHYMQPHQPFITKNRKESEWRGANCWEALRQGDVDRDTIWRAYRENVRVVLDDVETLLKNVDAERTVLTADHGNAVGEWGIYGHPNGFLHPAVKCVPWVETTAVDSGEYQPDWETDETELTVERRLEDLGYL